MAQEELLPDGAYGSTIHGGIKAGESKHFLLSAKQGQILQVSVITREVVKGARLELFDSRGESVLGGLETVTAVDTLNLVLPKKDRYTLWVKAGEKECSYVLEVTLDDPPPEEEDDKKPVRSAPKMEPPSPAPAPPEPSPSPPAKSPSVDDL